MNFKSMEITKIVIIVLAGVLLFWLVSSYNKNKTNITKEAFDPSDSELLQNGTPNVDPAEEEKNESYKGVDYETTQYPNDCFPKDKLTAEDLLPKDAANSTWAGVVPAGQGDVANINFLTAGFHSGIDTQMGTLKNANLSLRSEPINPRDVVSPWLQSSYEPDLNRRPLEIGQDTC